MVSIQIFRSLEKKHNHLLIRVDGDMQRYMLCGLMCGTHLDLSVEYLYTSLAIPTANEELSLTQKPGDIMFPTSR